MGLRSALPTAEQQTFFYDEAVVSEKGKTVRRPTNGTEGGVERKARGEKRHRDKPRAEERGNGATDMQSVRSEPGEYSQPHRTCAGESLGVSRWLGPDADAYRVHAPEPHRAGKIERRNIKKNNTRERRKR